MDADRLKNICKVGQGNACCRYLIAGTKGIGCAKLNESLKKTIDERVEAGLFVAVSDNCEGIPDES